MAVPAVDYVGHGVPDFDLVGQAVLYVDILQTLEDCYDWKISDFDFETKRARAVIALEKTLYSVVAWES